MFIRLTFRTEKTLTFKDQNFDIFASGSDEPVLSIHLTDTTAKGPHPVLSFYHPEDHRGGIEILSVLCHKVRTPSYGRQTYPALRQSIFSYSSCFRTSTPSFMVPNSFTSFLQLLKFNNRRFSREGAQRRRLGRKLLRGLSNQSGRPVPAMLGYTRVCGEQLRGTILSV